MPPNGKTFPINSNTLNADGSILLVPYGEDPLHVLADLLLDRHAAPVLALHRQTVLFPRASALPRFRQALLARMAAHKLSALLPPATMTLAAWAQRHADPAPRHLSDMACAWTLYDVLRSHPKLSRRFGTWPLIDSLLILFDELSHQRQSLPVTLHDFRRQLADGYGIKRDQLAPLEDEAELVFTLWQAWQEHLADNRLHDNSTMLADGLARGLATLPAGTRLYLAGLVETSRLELDWVRACLARGCLTLVLHGQAGGDGPHPAAPLVKLLQALDLPAAPRKNAPPLTRLLDRVYTHDGHSLSERALTQRQSRPESPACDRLGICETADVEHEARAIDLQVRRWLLAGQRNIGIVTNDRKLARRVRALLERAHIALEDAGGWTLSTTSAAAALVRWLECLEQDFPYTALLDLLKSPFVRIAQQQTVWQFEQAIVRERNIAGGFKRYRRALARHAGKLVERFGAGGAEAIGALLDALENAAAPLRSVRHSRRQDVAAFREALLESLDRLGMLSAYHQDDAGGQLLALIDDLRAPLANIPLQLNWAEFRHWLHRELERRRFRPALHGTGVELMGFAESRLYQFDALIVAGALHEHLPGQPAPTPFFNDGVRQQLGLPALAERLAMQFYDFRRLLEAAPRVLITLRRERDGERLAPSPWVEQLRAFHRLAYGDALHDTRLERLAQMRDIEVADRRAPRPAAPPAVAKVTPPPEYFPDTLSATAHQRLINCPYQFYCAEILGLAPEEEVREEIEKADYGSYVHRILQAFHAGVPGLPGPWRGPLTVDRLASASILMQEIAETVFAQDLRRSYLARGWLYRWLDSLPAYFAWQAKREAHWRIEAAEIRKESKICDGDVCLTLTGRIDRLDRGDDGCAIIDYKTGALPSREDVLDGEQVQLTHYALLCDDAPSQAQFLGLLRDGVTDKVRLEGQELGSIASQVRKRLLRLYRDMKQGTTLTAWGDPDTCEVCAMEGICRRELWSD